MTTMTKMAPEVRENEWMGGKYYRPTVRQKIMLIDVRTMIEMSLKICENYIALQNTC